MKWAETIGAITSPPNEQLVEAGQMTLTNADKRTNEKRERNREQMTEAETD